MHDECNARRPALNAQGGSHRVTSQSSIVGLLESVRRSSFHSLILLGDIFDVVLHCFRQSLYVFWQDRENQKVRTSEHTCVSCLGAFTSQ